MNKLKITIITEFLLTFVLIILLYWGVRSFLNCVSYLNIARGDEVGSSLYIECMHYFYVHLALGIATMISCIFDIIAAILIALKDIKIFQPLVDKFNSRKQARAAAREAKAKESKQKQIAELEQKLDELKKDE